MFGKKKLTNPEVQEAIDQRDALMAAVEGAVKKVDRLQGELLQEYVEAERRRRVQWM